MNLSMFHQGGRGSLIDGILQFFSSHYKGKGGGGDFEYAQCFYHLFYGGHPSHINLNETDSFLASFYVPSLKKIYVYILDKRRVKRTVENFTQGDSDRQFLT